MGARRLAVRIGSGQQDSELYKAMYERDFAGHRFAGGMLDTELAVLRADDRHFSREDLRPFTGNQASSTIFDSSQSATPVIAFYRRRAKYISPVMGGY